MKSKNSKVIEAPEKIWINPSMDLPKLNGVIDKESVQYIRKDVFIEKVTKWINEHTSLSEKLVIENFRKYMEGE